MWRARHPWQRRCRKEWLSYFSYFFCAFPSHTCLPLHVCFLFAYKTQKSTCSAGLNYRLINSTCKMNWLTWHLAFGLQYCGLNLSTRTNKKIEYNDYSFYGNFHHKNLYSLMPLEKFHLWSYPKHKTLHKHHVLNSLKQRYNETTQVW